MTEHTFIDSIHRKLTPHEVYKWKINAAFSNGVPDAYYSGDKADVWVEYKFGTSHQLTALQHKWLTDRHAEGRACWLVWGFDVERVAVITEAPYPMRLKPQNAGALVHRNAVVDMIINHCCTPRVVTQ